MRVALVHDWLIGTRGGERVLDALCELFPDAEVFTLVHQPGSVPKRVEGRHVHTSFLQRIPGVFERYRLLLPLMPKAIESFDLSGFDLVVSSSHCVAKGVRTRAPHLAYVHAPMRYMWDRYDDYFGSQRAAAPVRWAAAAFRPSLQRWDRASAQRPGRFVANSLHVAEQIQRLYGRSAQVVHPFIDAERFAPGGGVGGYFLWLGAPAPYKRLDLAIEAFRGLSAELWIAGAGMRPTDRALPPNVRWLGQVADADVPGLYRGARALVFPGQEDFGLTPVEAQACGRPVIAYGRGGVLEGATPDTALFFSEQTALALRQAVQGFDAWEKRFDPAKAVANAARFTRARFLEGIRQEVGELLGRPLW